MVAPMCGVAALAWLAETENTFRQDKRTILFRPVVIDESKKFYKTRSTDQLLILQNWFF